MGWTNIPTSTVSKADVGLGNVENVLQAPLHSTINAKKYSYVLLLTDDGKMIDMDKATATTLTVPLNSSVAFVIGTVISLKQEGAGACTITPTGGVTINSLNGLVTNGQYAVCSIMKVATDEWVAFGALTT